MYLYEIIEDYKNAKSQSEKDEIFNSFCNSIWSSKNKRRIYTKAIKFYVRKDLLDTELGQIFDAWSSIEYKYYKSMTNNRDWCSLIRQKINNIYTIYFDKEVIIKKEYMDLIKLPKQLYYQWLSGVELDCDTVTSLIDEAIDKSIIVKERFQKEKMVLSWSLYKKIIEGFLHRCFENCKLIEDYENNKKISNIFDYVTEEHLYVKYFSDYINYEILQWQKKYYGVRYHKKYKRCKLCGALIEIKGRNQQYCKNCSKKRRLETKRNWWNNRH